MVQEAYWYSCWRCQTQRSHQLVSEKAELEEDTLNPKPTDPKLKKRKPNVSKGDANIARRRNASGGPVQHPRGPNSSFFENEQAEANAVKAPLNSEDKDISQFSLEYNKWGNLVGINFQLNEDGSTLKDPDSIESDVDSRWSWNAIASGKKGYLNKLLIK